ncbi:MAG TPA: hypothetical protein VKY74_27275 [Chloroflexia bacterium]|nr:hypothetical protein [Chloroflexia bacterium]
MDWTNFYLGAAGAAATLVGLLFIAVQFNIDAFVLEPGNRWRAVARSTFAIYTLLFVLPLFLLIPGLDHGTRGLALLLLASFGSVRAVITWLPVWRGLGHHRGERFGQTAWLLVGPLLAYAALISNALTIYFTEQADGAQIAVGLTLVGLFVIALRNSWNLLFELTYERKRNSPPPPP